MTEDEILLLADHLIKKPVCVQIVTHMELMKFARAIEQRTLTNQKAQWFKEGQESGIRACAKWLRETDPNEDIGDADAKGLLSHFGVTDE